MAGRVPASREQVREFWRLRLAGVSNDEAAARVGVSAITGYGWVVKSGGVIPDLDRPTGRLLSLAEREEIAIGWERGESYHQIGARIGRPHTTVMREIKRNSTRRPPPAPRPDGRPHPKGPMPGTHRGRDRPRHQRLHYRASSAQVRADHQARRPKPCKLAENPELLERVRADLAACWSPQQIARRLRRDFPDHPEMWVSHETIYQELYVQTRGRLRRELTTCLRTGRALRRPRRLADQRRARTAEKVPNKVMISQRPAEAADRAVPGHWEGDLITGEANGSAIGTLVERSTRFVLLLHLPSDHRAETVRDAMIPAIASLPEMLRRSLTWDQGVEMARHEQISIATGLPIYFCDPHSPWQRGSNENTNGLLRQYFPKGTDLSVHTADDLAAVAAELNGRPRMTLGWDTPAEALARLLSQPVTISGGAATP